MFELSGKRQEILDTVGNLLVMGGPGSGKTTIALFKAAHEIQSGKLNREQKILFLSFARATISRVEQHAKGIVHESIAPFIEINTYHGFIWTILRSHGRLLIPHKLRLLPPHDASFRLSSFAPEDRHAEIMRLFQEEGLLHFDVFAKNCTELLTRSAALTKIITAAYPIIMLDEFQDTNQDEWALISHLGKHSTLIALADPEQRIYDFRGSDPKRIGQFIEEYNPAIFDFGTENNRSNGTDLVEFGNDLLNGRNKGKQYKSVKVNRYTPMQKNAQLIYLKLHLLGRLKANKANKDWSLAILTPSNRMMLTISEFIGKRHKMNNGSIVPAIHHDVSIDPFGPAIAAITVAKLLELASQRKCGLADISSALCEHILGRERRSDRISKSDQDLTKAITDYITAGDYSRDIRGKTRQAIIEESKNIAARCNEIEFTGDVIGDWVKVRDSLGIGTVEYIKTLYNDSLYIRLLRKGSILDSSLGQIWRDNGHYVGAVEAVQNAITQEHFTASTKVWTGINVMTIHKAKGKEFDEVIIYEGIYDGRIVVRNDLDRAKLNLRVAVTRAKKSAIIETPSNDPCPLL